MTATAAPYRFRLLLMLLAVAIHVQVSAPFSSAGTRIALSDPLVAAIVGMAAIGGFAIAFVTFHRLLAAALLAVTATLALALYLGYVRLGYMSGWALLPKFVGWFALVAHFLCGSWIASLGEGARRAFVHWFVLSCTAVTAITGLTALVLSQWDIIPSWLTRIPLHGLVGNRNAYSFLVIIAIACLIADAVRTRPLFGGLGRATVAAVLGLGLFFSGSRAAMGVGALMLAAALPLRLLSWRTVAQGIAIAAVLVAAGAAVRELVLILTVRPDAQSVFFTSPPSSIDERWSGLAGAIDLWRDNPLFGVGLGVFIETQTHATGIPSIIHNSVLWLLSETGLVGLAAFVALFAILLRHVWPADAADDERAVRITVLLILAAFAAMAQVHELLYQRVLWLFLGLVLIVPRREGPCRW